MSSTVNDPAVAHRWPTQIDRHREGGCQHRETRQMYLNRQSLLIHQKHSNAKFNILIWTCAHTCTQLYTDVTQSSGNIPKKTYPVQTHSNKNIGQVRVFLSQQPYAWAVKRYNFCPPCKHNIDSNPNILLRIFKGNTQMW